jgi:hypothetical protein
MAEMDHPWARSACASTSSSRANIPWGSSRSDGLDTASIGGAPPCSRDPGLGRWGTSVSRSGEFYVSVVMGARLRPDKDETRRAALDAAVQHRHDAASVPSQCATTIHKAKGQEFDSVIVAHCSAPPFPDKPDARRPLYVALSRARRSITIIASERNPSPLLTDRLPGGGPRVRRWFASTSRTVPGGCTGGSVPRDRVARACSV